MLATNTPNFNLKQWNSTDKPSMEDFNSLNIKIDESLTTLRDGKTDKAYTNTAMPGITTLEGAVTSLSEK